MKVLMMTRPDAFEIMGGDTIQMLETKKGLEAQGIKVDISTNLKEDLEEYDIIHIFNIMRPYETYLQVRNAIKYNKKIAISPIYQSRHMIKKYYQYGFYGHSKLETFIAGNPYIFNYIKNWKVILKNPLLIFKRFDQLQKYIIQQADIILPNSLMELEAIKNDLTNTYQNYCIVPNGVDESYFDSIEQDEVIVSEKYIFCPGRIEPLKNQISIMKALEETDIQVIFAGQKNMKHRKYIEEFEKLIKENKNYIYIGKVSSEEIKKWYKGSKVTALCSWFETTGLVGLEGGSLGTNVIITNNGYTEEYFKDFVEYIDPASVKSIKESLLKAWDKPTNSLLKQHIKSNYMWSNAIKATIEGYKKIYN